MEELVRKLNDATRLYDEGHPIMTDKEWDDLYFTLLRMENTTKAALPNSPTQKIHYELKTKLEKVKHSHPMLSLDKTKEIDDIVKFGAGKKMIAMLKMDGLTASIKYDNRRVVSGETRGDGAAGEDITHNIKVLKSVPKMIQSDTLEIDGEIICPLDIFEAEFNSEYKNARNFASGSIRLLDAKESYNRKLTFVAWEAIDRGEDDSLSQSLLRLVREGFITVPFFCDISTREEIEDAIKSLKKIADTLHYPIDGIVFKYDNYEEYDAAGRTDHHFKGGLAYKFYDEEFISTLRDIDWTMGRTGILTPVAVFDPIDIDGSVVERASMHNISIMESLYSDDWYNGLKVTLYKANQIIPQISKVELINSDLAKRLDPPRTCPVCGEKTEIVTTDGGVKVLYCSNNACEGKLVNKIDHFSGRKGMNIKGLSVKTLEKLIDWGWVNSILDIYNLEQCYEEWIKKPGFGAKSVRNILDSIENSKHNGILEKFICSIGIPLIGHTASTEICRHVSSWEEFRAKVRSEFDFGTFNNFGYEMNKSILNFDYEEFDRIAEMIEFEQMKPQKKTGDSLCDLTFVITGKLVIHPNRQSLEKIIKDNGGKVSSSVSTRTSYLINNDTNSTSSKNIKAKELDVPIISEKEFLDLIN